MASYLKGYLPSGIGNYLLGNTNVDKKDIFDQREKIIVENLSDRIHAIIGIKDNGNTPLMYSLANIVINQIVQEFEKRAQQLKSKIQYDPEYKALDIYGVDNYVKIDYREKLIQIIIDILDKYRLTQFYDDFAKFFRVADTTSVNEDKRHYVAALREEAIKNLSSKGFHKNTPEYASKMNELNRHLNPRIPVKTWAQRARSRSRIPESSSAQGGKRNIMKKRSKTRKHA